MDEASDVLPIVEVLGEYAKRKKALSCPEDALELLRLIKRIHEVAAAHSFYIVAEPKGEEQGYMPLAYEEEEGPYLYASSNKEEAIKHLGENDQLLLAKGEDVYHAFFEGRETFKGILFDPDSDFYTMTSAEFEEALLQGTAYEEKWAKMEARLQANIKVKKPSKA